MALGASIAAGPAHGAPLGELREKLVPFYSEIGRPSIDASLFLRKIRLLPGACEEVELHLAYRWFCRLDLDDKVPVGSQRRSKRWEPAGTLRDYQITTVLNQRRRYVIKETAISWSSHRCSMMGAALAYYSIFSFGPLLVISTAIAGLVFGPDAAHGEIAAQVAGLLGSAGAEALETLLAAANHPYQGALATIFGIGTLLFAAVGVVAQLKEALNTVWGVETSNSSGLLQLIRTYVISLAGVLSLGFLLLVSLIFTAALAAIGKFVAPYFPEAAFQITGSVVSFGFVAILFAMMFKWLPDTQVDWRDVWLGAALAAAMFEMGKFLIGFYVGKQALESTYGAATSLVMLLIWVYYSAQIVLFGAEFTHVYARRRGMGRAEPLVRVKA